MTIHAVMRTPNRPHHNYKEPFFMSSTKNRSQSHSDLHESFHSLLIHLEAVSQKSDFLVQREIALSQFLQPYLVKDQGFTLNALPAEIELAKLFLYSDYFPNDGHLSLVEQVRDEIIEHIPAEAREWLDPIRHSFMDLLEISALGTAESPHEVILKSLGDGIEYRVISEDLVRENTPGQILLTRLIRQPDYTLFPGMAIGLSVNRGRQLYDYVRDLQREMEAETGVFELGEWQEFTKRFGHVLIWALAQLRLQWLLEVEDHITFHTSRNAPYLFCIGVYEHHEPKFFNEMLQEAQEWVSEPLEKSMHPNSQINRPSDMAPLTVWVNLSDDPSQEQPRVISRVTITPSQIFAESNSLDHFNDVKHFLASTFGFSLHFKGEITDPPFHTIPGFDLLSDDIPRLNPIVSKDEEHESLAQLLESVYLGWAEHPCPALQKESPRHFALDPEGKTKVATLIDELEQNDLAFLRTGKWGFDYQTLRVHVGLDEEV
jgi:hypothetical protein